MSEYDNTNTGALFTNDKGDNPKRPDYKGNLNVNGVEYQLSGWNRQSKKSGESFLSLKIEPKQDRKPDGYQRQAPPQDAHNRAKADGYAPAKDDGDDIPF